MLSDNLYLKGGSSIFAAGVWWMPVYFFYIYYIYYLLSTQLWSTIWNKVFHQRASATAGESYKPSATAGHQKFPPRFNIIIQSFKIVLPPVWVVFQLFYARIHVCASRFRLFYTIFTRKWKKIRRNKIYHRVSFLSPNLLIKNREEEI